MKNIFIIGSQGYEKKYGGWETFVKNLCDFYDKSKANLFVTELSFEKNTDIYVKNDINCIPVKTINIGNATMFINAILAFIKVIFYISKNKIENPIIYILGLRLGPILGFSRPYLKFKKIKVFVNPDGLEWKRSKWNKFIKFCFKYSEMTMTKHCDGIVCDSKGIKTYLEEEYPKNKVKKHFIAYGTKIVNLDSVDEMQILSDYKLKKEDYYLVVARCVPENNFELIINEFMKSNTKKKLIIISNITGNSYYDEFKNITNCDSDKRIIVLPGIYDEVKLSVIRKNAFAYIHGHSVGGTNPSLLEALSLTKLNILYDVNFNHLVGLNSCLYFFNEGSLTKILNKEEKLKSLRKEKGVLAKKRITDEYTWEYIINKYEKIFK